MRSTWKRCSWPSPAAASKRTRRRTSTTSAVDDHDNPHAGAERRCPSWKEPGHDDRRFGGRPPRPAPPARRKPSRSCSAGPSSSARRTSGSATGRGSWSGWSTGWSTPWPSRSSPRKPPSRERSIAAQAVPAHAIPADRHPGLGLHVRGPRRHEPGHHVGALGGDDRAHPDDAGAPSGAPARHVGFRCAPRLDPHHPDPRLLAPVLLRRRRTGRTGRPPRPSSRSGP